MLFDLQGRRKTFIKFVYLGLAILIGGGLVLFGVGSSVNGGLADALNGGGNNSETYKKDVEKNAIRVARQPKNPQALAALIKSRYSLAGSADNFDTGGSFNKNGVEILRQLVRDWTQYTAVVKKADPQIANYAVSAYSALNDLEGAKKAQQTLVEVQDPPTAQSYVQLVQFALLTGDDRVARLAERRAIALSPATKRAELRRGLKQLRSEIQKQQIEQARKQAEQQINKGLQDGATQ